MSLTTNHISSPRPSRRTVLQGAGIAALGAAFGAPLSSAPAAAEVSGAAETSHLSRADRVFLRRGLRHGAWIAQTEMGWAPSGELFRSSGFTDPTWYDAPLWNAPLMAELPEVPWSATKGPSGYHLKGGETVPTPILTGEASRRAGDLFTFCMGDEDPYSTEMVATLTAMFAQLRTEAPDALLHTNQYAGQWNDDQMTTFMRECEPDLITFDEYNFSWGSGHADGSVTSAYDNIARYRRLAMAGNDGSGLDPIQFGQYSMGFRSGDAAWKEGGTYVISQSQQSLVPCLTWTAGGRWNDLFRWQNGDDALLSRPDHNGQTLQFARYQEINRVRKALSPYLTRLRTRSLSVFTAATDPGTRIRTVDVVNIGGANGGLPGDVLIGTFRPIPGMTTQEAGVFANPDTPAFMVMNGLVLPNTDPADELGTGGNGAETRQAITLTFDLDSAVNPGRLWVVDPASGVLKHLQVRRNTDKRWSATIELDGGTAALLLWDVKG